MLAPHGDADRGADRPAGTGKLPDQVLADRDVGVIGCIPAGVATPMILNDFVVNRMRENPNPAVSQVLLPAMSIPVDAGHVV
jgi:hypothetical protein